MIMQAEFKQGEHDGEFRSWWNNGNLKEEGQFSFGKRIGKYRWYDEDGTLLQEHIYE